MLAARLSALEIWGQLVSLGPSVSSFLLPRKKIQPYPPFMSQQQSPPETPESLDPWPQGWQQEGTVHCSQTP